MTAPPPTESLHTVPLYRDDAYRRECTATVLEVDQSGVVLDQSVFYPHGGGQLGDTGQLRTESGVCLPVRDTVKSAEHGQRHVIDSPSMAGSATASAAASVGAGAPVVTDAVSEIIADSALCAGDRVTLELDWTRRYRLMRFHSALHLLCSLIDAPVTSGSIQVDRARLDFDLPESPDKAALTAALNELVDRDASMSTRYITDAELDAQPELVRTMSVQPPRNASGTIRLVEFDGIDLQPCGGTHVASTAEIGALRVQKIEKKGRQNRRIIIVFD